MGFPRRRPLAAGEVCDGRAQAIARAGQAQLLDQAQIEEGLPGRVYRRHADEGGDPEGGLCREKPKVPWDEFSEAQ